MVIYIFLALYFVLFNKNKDRILLLIGFLLLFIVSSFRGMTVGVDTLNYLDEYNSIKNGIIAPSSLLIHEEPLFNLIYYYLIHLGASYRVILIVQTLLFLIPISYVVLKLNERPIESLAFMYLLGFFFMEFNIVRQAIAISFILLGFYYLSKNKIIGFLMAVLVAEGFHTTSFIVLPVLLLPYIKLPKKLTIVVLLASFVVPLVYDITAGILNNSGLMDAVGDISAFGHYMSQEYDMMTRLPIFPSLRTLLFIYIIIWDNNNKHLNDLFFKISLLYVIGSNIMMSTPSFVGRVMYYFEIAFIIYLVRWVKEGQLQKMTTYFYVLLYFIYYYIVLNTEGIKPYVFL